MGIVDYKLKAKKSKENLMNNSSISEKNKQYVKGFLDGYDVSSARMNIFCKHIGFLLERSENIKEDMLDRSKINLIFKDIREKTRLSYYETIKAVSLVFVRWLNEGDKPLGFKDIKNSKKGQKRNLRPRDMVTWKDAEKMLDFVNSVQLKAILMTQLDGGFRPSEFVDIDYGDVNINGDVIIINVKKGKTGVRDVILFKCVPYLKKWLELHPEKMDNSPLWVTEYPSQSRKKEFKLRYSYDAMRKQIRKIGKMAKINKPLDFYNLRHSACTISKKENVNPELASMKFGHSIKYYTETYGRLTIEENVDRYKKHYKSISDKGENDYVPMECHICHHVNPLKSEFCVKCNNPLSFEVALKKVSKYDDMVKELEIEKKARIEQYKKVNEVLKVLIKSVRDPKVASIVSDYIK